MAQLNIYVPPDLEKRIRAEARRRRLTLSAYIVGLIRDRLERKRGWMDGFFESVVGGWHGDFPEVERDPPEERRTR